MYIFFIIIIIISNFFYIKTIKVQEAVDSLPNEAENERIVFIKSGTYYEQVTIKKDYVTLMGEDKNQVWITYDLNNNKTGSSSECATVRANANHFKAFDLTFENTAPFPGSNAQAPAFYSKGEYHYIENCDFYSYQDTLLSYTGTHYFKNCFIQGLTDFIWGYGRAVFENCTLSVVSKENKKKGYLTASGNRDENYKEGGFLITQSEVISDGATFYLGRTWRPYCYVIFDRVTFPGNKIIADAWLPFKNHEDYVYTSVVGEYQCSGEGYSKEGRVEWQTEFDSVPSIEEFLGGDLSFVSETIYHQEEIDFDDAETTTLSIEDTETATVSTETMTETETETETVISTSIDSDDCPNHLFFQCGGQNFKGHTCCPKGSTCTKINEWYSYCNNTKE